MQVTVTHESVVLDWYADKKEAHEVMMDLLAVLKWEGIQGQMLSIEPFGRGFQVVLWRRVN